MLNLRAVEESTPSAARTPFDRCPMCSTGALRVFREDSCQSHPLYQPSLPPTIRWARCEYCDHVCTDGYFAEQAMATIFVRANESQKVGHDMERQRIIAAQIVSRVAAIAPAGAWLDVGFGNAALLFAADEFGYEPVGLDLRADNVKALKACGYEAHQAEITALGQGARFDVISMCDVLEHMPFPDLALQAARKLLRPGGCLFLSLPNMDCALWQYLDATGANPYWSEIEHFHNFGRRGLYGLLELRKFAQPTYGVSHRYRIGMEITARASA